MKFTTYSHCDGDGSVPKPIQAGLAQAFAAVKSQKSWTAKQLKTDVEEQLTASGWTNRMPLSMNSKITIAAMKGNVGLAWQIGNASRMYADLMKLQALYLDGKIESAVFITGSPKLAKMLSGNVIKADRVERELPIFKKVITVPVIVYSLEP